MENFRVDELHQNTLQISLSKNARIKISVVEESKEYSDPLGVESKGDYYFVLANPNDSDDQTKSIVQEVFNLYIKELPALNFAANNGKESMSINRHLTNRKCCTLIIKSQENGHPGEVIGAITYRLVVVDTHYAEIPLAAVGSIFQQKGIGRVLYLELRKRLQSVGIQTLVCWADKRSEGFWLKQGFEVTGEVDREGRACSLHSKINVRKSLCFPCATTLMMSDIHKENPFEPMDIVSLPFSTELSKSSFRSQKTGLASSKLSESDKLLFEEVPLPGYQDSGILSATDFVYDDEPMEGGNESKLMNCSCLINATKRRMWEASCTSLKSKRVKGTRASDSQIGFNNFCNRNCLLNNENYSSGVFLQNPGSINGTNKEYAIVNQTNEDYGGQDISSAPNAYRIMLMNVGGTKKSNLTKMIENLGGVVTSNGSESTHVVTVKVGTTLNFCTALCSGSWVVSPDWLKESFKKGRFVDETVFLLDDEDYSAEYDLEFKIANLRAKRSPNLLFKGFDIWVAGHVQPPKRTILTIVKHAGGNVILSKSEISDVKKTVYIACDEDMEEASVASKLGILIFGVEWLMSCIMKQQVDFDAIQFAESL